MIGKTNAIAGNITYSPTDFGFITCLYPPGAVITCTDGSTTKGSSDQIGAIIFGVPNSGTWTITITNGTRTSSKTANISTAGEIVFIKIGFETYLIEDGTPLVTFSGVASPNSQHNGTGNNLYHYIFQCSYSYDGNTGSMNPYTTDPISPGINTKVVWKRTYNNSATGYLRIWKSTGSVTGNNYLAQAQITASINTVELAIPTGYSEIRVGFYVPYPKALGVNQLYLI